MPRFRDPIDKFLITCMCAASLFVGIAIATEYWKHH
jgi:hypothetical protein